MMQKIIGQFYKIICSCKKLTMIVDAEMTKVRRLYIDCRQFHQRFTRAFFVQSFGAKNYKSVFWGLKFFGTKISA